MKEAVMLWLEGDAVDVSKFVQWLRGHQHVARLDEMIHNSDEAQRVQRAKDTIDWVEGKRELHVVAQIPSVDPANEKST